MLTIKVTKPVEVKFDAIKVMCEPRHFEDDCPNWPNHLRQNESLVFTIDLGGPKGDIAIIRDWDGGAFALHTKCTDSCFTYLMDGDMPVVEKEMDVPSCFPGMHYNEYLILDVAEDGRITNWKASAADYQEAFGTKG